MTVSWLSGRSARTLGALTIAFAIGGFAIASPTSARVMHPPVDGTGGVSCNVVGALKFNPALKVTSTPVPTTVTLHVVLNQCTGTGDAANVVVGIANVSGQAASNDCLTLLTNAASAARSGPLRWVVKPRTVGSSRVDLQACKLEYSIVSPK